MTETTINRPYIEQQMEQAGKEIERMMSDYPCMREICKGLDKAAYPAALFTGACLLGTLMTRCTYHFYFEPKEERRLNYGVYIIGDPGTGKSFAVRLYNLLAEPIIRVSKEGMNAVNRYKRKYKEWENGGQKGDGPVKPKALIRTHPARTSNKVFIEDMNNAIDVVDGKEMHLHLLSFDSELDNATRLQGEAWNNKFFMELKAFHNEEDGECYVNGALYPSFKVFWNYVYTGTPLALEHKVNAGNIGTGLATRLAAIPMPATHFRMMKREKLEDASKEPEEDIMLRMWAERLNTVKGELPIKRLVDECYEWTARRMADAEEDQSQADELMCKRVAYYGINVSVPFIMMRHWDEWQQYGTLTIDDTDVYLCLLVCNIQFCCQRYYFGRYWESYFLQRKLVANSNMLSKKYSSKMKQRYRRLPDIFMTYDVMSECGVKQRNAEKMVERWLKEGYIKKTDAYAVYEKVILELL